MSVFDELEAQYNEIDQYYAALEFQASSRGWVRKEEHFRQQRQINDQAYFLFMFTRLEDHIREQSSKLISRRRNNNSSWQRHAPWDILADQASNDCLAFRARLALLCLKGQADLCASIHLLPRTECHCSRR